MIVFFAMKKFLSLLRTDLLIVCLIAYANGVLFRKSSAQVSSKLFLIFSSNLFKVFFLDTEVFDQFLKLILIHSDEYEHIWILLHAVILFYQEEFLKMFFKELPLMEVTSR